MESIVPWFKNRSDSITYFRPFHLLCKGLQLLLLLAVSRFAKLFGRSYIIQNSHCSPSYYYSINYYLTRPLAVALKLCIKSSLRINSVEDLAHIYTEVPKWDIPKSCSVMCGMCAQRSTSCRVSMSCLHHSGSFDKNKDHKRGPCGNETDVDSWLFSLHPVCLSVPHDKVPGGVAASARQEQDRP